jgi:hypothetical protein
MRFRERFETLTSSVAFSLRYKVATFPEWGRLQQGADSWLPLKGKARVPATGGGTTTSKNHRVGGAAVGGRKKITDVNRHKKLIFKKFVKK